MMMPGKALTTTPPAVAFLNQLRRLAVQGKMLLDPEQQSRIAMVLGCRVDELFTEGR